MFLSKEDWKKLDRVVIVTVKKSMRRWASFYIDQLPRYQDVQTELAGTRPKSRVLAGFRAHTL